MMQALQRAVVIPQIQVTMNRAPRRQVLRDRAPLASRAQHVHETVDDLPHGNRPLAATPLGRRDQRLDKPPLLVRQITRIA